MSYGEQKLIESLKKEIEELKEEKRRMNKQSKPSSDMKTQEVLGVGLAVGASALLIADYLKERKKEKEDEKYQELCRRYNWTQADQDKYGNCDLLYNRIRRCMDVNKLSYEEARKKVMNIGFDPNKCKSNYSWLPMEKRPGYKVIIIPNKEHPWKPGKKIYVKVDENKEKSTEKKAWKK